MLGNFYAHRTKYEEIMRLERNIRDQKGIAEHGSREWVSYPDREPDPQHKTNKKLLLL